MPCQLIQPVPAKWYSLGYSIIGIGNCIAALVPAKTKCNTTSSYVGTNLRLSSCRVEWNGKSLVADKEKQM